MFSNCEIIFQKCHSVHSIYFAHKMTWMAAMNMILREENKYVDFLSVDDVWHTQIIPELFHIKIICMGGWRKDLSLFEINENKR